MLYTDKGEATPLPQTAAQVFGGRDSVLSYLGVRVGGLLFNCHFFTDEEIEFDLDPREVKGQDTLDAVLTFMRGIGQAVGKRVILTPESLVVVLLARYASETGGSLLCPQPLDLESIGLG